ncbi:hypothetical protein BH09PAT4_BH09PAT4_06060 [soil metagenome]
MVIACNTAHLLLPQLQQEFGDVFVSLIAATVSELKKRNIKVCGLLASPTTIKTKLYEQTLVGEGIRCVVPKPSEQLLVEEQIRSVISGQACAPSDLAPLLSGMGTVGAEATILGCTELSVLFEGAETKELIDPLDLVVSRLLVNTGEGGASGS